ncbi:MAG: hypothetical protein ACJATI_004616 [Halioglobus sp.]|jgi:hypothetical protein
MNNKELEILMDKHVMGTLSDMEHASLEVELLQNPSLATELNTHKDLVKGVQYAGELELQNMLDKIHYQQSGVTPPGSKRSNVPYFILGLVMLLGIASYFILSNKTTEKINTKSIYAALYTQYEPSLQDRGTSLDKSIISFNEAYVAKNYQLALTIIKPYLAKSGNDIKLSAAISANETNDIILAENLLDEIIESNDYYFVDHAIWYKALIKLKTNETTTIKEILTPLIKNPKSDHHKEAIELISKLDG